MSLVALVLSVVYLVAWLGTLGRSELGGEDCQRPLPGILCARLGRSGARRARRPGLVGSAGRARCEPTGWLPTGRSRPCETRSTRQCWLPHSGPRCSRRRSWLRSPWPAASSGWRSRRGGWRSPSCGRDTVAPTLATRGASAGFSPAPGACPSMPVTEYPLPVRSSAWRDRGSATGHRDDWRDRGGRSGAAPS